MDDCGGYVCPHALNFMAPGSAAYAFATVSPVSTFKTLTFYAKPAQKSTILKNFTVVRERITDLAISLVLTTFGEQAQEIRLCPPDCFSPEGTCELNIRPLYLHTYAHTHLPLSPQFAMYPVQDPRLLLDRLVALWIHCTMKVEKHMFEAATSPDEHYQLLSGRICQIHKVQVKYGLEKRMKMSVPKIGEIYPCPVHSSAWKGNI